MRDELLAHYERELSYIRRLGAEFAEKYPKIAGRLLLEADKCEDPHVERLIEAFAFLAARVRLKIDDEFPEITESLLGILYPHYLTPVPSMSVVQFVFDPEEVNLQAGHTIPRHSRLSSRGVDGTPCRFRTCYPVTVWPVELSSAQFRNQERNVPGSTEIRSVLRLELHALGDIPFSRLKEKVSETEERPLDHLRFCLQGEDKLVYGLYEMLFNNVVQVELRPGKGGGPKEAITLPPSCLRPVGFEQDEGILPGTNRSFLGYRLLQEFFTFPEKFLFVDLCQLEKVAGKAFQDTLEVLIYFNRGFNYENDVSAQTFRLNCAPIVNLFQQAAEPIRLTHLQNEYHVMADVRRQLATEVHSIDRVESIDPRTGQTTSFEPFYSYRHGASREQQRTFWYASRRASHHKDDEGTEVYITLVDLGFSPSVPDVETLTVQVTCSNRDLPGRLPFGRPEGDFQLEGAGLFRSIRCLKKPTATLRMPLRQGVQWRLISHLSLNYLSLIQGGEGGGAEPLQEILKLYDIADSMVTRRQIAGILGVSARRVVRCLDSGFVRGFEVAIHFDEQYYVGGSVFLFAAVLERFLGLYASVNSFSQLAASIQQREGLLKRWPPRAGEQIIL